MRIGMILGDKFFPPDIRVEKEARVLLNAGFQVALLSSRKGSNQADHEVAEDGLHLFRTDTPRLSLSGVSRRPRLRLIARGLLRRKKYKVPSWSYVLGWEGYRFWKSGISGDWRKSILRFISDFEPDVLHVHDFVLVPTALVAARIRGLPVVADLHENWPAALVVNRLHLQQEHARREFDTWWNYDLWRDRERKALPKCAVVIVVVPEAAERLYSYGVAKEQVVVVSNTEDETTFGREPLDSAILKQYAGRWVALYVGSVGHHRGLDVVIRAIPQVIPHRQDFLLLIVGAGRDYKNRLQKLADEAGVGEHVEILGWQPGNTVSSYIAASAACLVPHRNLEHTNTTIPHKLFQYMIMGKPVVVSSCPPLKRVVEETQSGVVFAADDPDSAAKALITLCRNPSAAKEYGENGRRAASGPYSWRKDARRLIELYRKLEADA